MFVLRAFGLLLVFTTAKLLLAVLRTTGSGHLPFSPLLPFVLLHQDVIVVLVWAAVDGAVCALGRRSARATRYVERTLFVLYALVVIYTAINVPVALRLSTPLTHSMLGAVGRALSSSIVKYITVTNVSAMLLIPLAAAAPFVLRLRLLPCPTLRTAGFAAAALFGVAVVGSFAAKRTESLGLHRNPLMALAATTVKRWGKQERVDHAAAPPALPDEGNVVDLSHYRGKAAGRSVIWVILESTGARYIGAYGKRPDPTPRLTAFAESALVFDSVHCAIPDSIRGLFSMLCSMEPKPYVGIDEYTADRTRCSSIAQVVGRAGYRAALFHSGRFRYLGMQGIVSGRGFGELYDADGIRGAYESPFGIDDASTARRLLSFVDSVPKGERFFAVYSPIAGHHPYKAPGPGYGSLPGRSDLELYLNDLSTGDVAFGQIVDGVKERGLLEQTLFVIVGDHGQAFQQHPGNFGHTLFVYEENTHVPLIVVAPGLVRERVRVPQLGSLLDMAPTTLALLGIPAPPEFQGRALLDPKPGFARFMTDHDLLKAGLRHGHWKFLYESEFERSRLFDLRTDAGELHDLSEREPARTALYRNQVLTWLAPGR